MSSTASFQLNEARGVISFDDIWLALYEGREIEFTDEGATMAGTIHSAAAKAGFFGTFYSMTIKALVHDGTAFSEKEIECRIPAFRDAEKLSSLPVRPLGPVLKESLSARGAKALSMIESGSCYSHYSGEVIQRAWWGTKRYRATGRIMLDPKTFRRMNEDYSQNVIKARPRGDDEESKILSSNEIAPSDYWRISPWVTGFSFAAKQWGECDIDHVHPIQFNTEAYDHLVLPAREVEGLHIDPKSMIQSLVEHGSVGFTDVIADKGGGIIFLLHGPPGTGKTLTAEAISDLLKRPLYSVSVGELGTKTTELEKNLRTILEVATLWNAVLLIDEADIFLERRTPRDIERNALVAIFLRMLEYYQGVLFLTTNRVKEFDPAFSSRVSIALDYPAHDRKSRAMIWKSLLRAAGLRPADYNIELLANEDVNGRQIKHSIRIGLSLAQNEKRPVELVDFMKTIRLAQLFNKHSSEDFEHASEPEPASEPERPRQPKSKPRPPMPPNGTFQS